MRTRIALAAATSVTFISSTISLVAGHGPAAAAARPGHSSSARAPRHGRTIARTLPRHGITLISATDLRNLELSGHEAIGTFSPLSDRARGWAAGHPGRHPATHARSVPAPVAASASVGTFVSAPAPAPAPAFPATDIAAPPVPPPPPAPPPPPPPADWSSTDTADWQCIRIHESGDVYNDPSRPSGAYGILDSTWLSLGYSGWPYQAPATVQDDAALTLYREYGWQPWSSRYACGL